MIKERVGPAPAGPEWTSFSKVAGAAALVAVLVALAEISIQFLPGVAQASQRTATVADWFALLQNNCFLGLRNLGLLNLIGAAVLTPTFLGMYFALRRERTNPGRVLGAVLFAIEMAINVADNRAFAMLSFSRQYAGAVTQR